MRPTYAERQVLIAQRRRKAFILIGLLIFFSFMATTLFGESGILVNMRVKAEHERLKQERDRIRSQNQRLLNEIRALKSNPRKIEEIGRSELGFGRPGEVIFYFPEDGKKAVQTYQNPKD